MLSYFTHGDVVLKGIDDTELFNAATRVFIKKGYTNTTFADIATFMGISEVSLRQRFETKEELYTFVLLKMADTEEFFDECRDLLSSLVVILDELKKEIRGNADRAEFFFMLITSKDIPDSSKAALKEDVLKSRIYSELRRAQMAGEILSGDIYSLIKKFVVSSFLILRGMNDGGIEFPDNDFFLRLLGYCDPENTLNDKEIIKKQNSVIAAFASDFQSILFVDLDTNLIDVYQLNGDHDDWILANAPRGFKEYTSRFAEKYISEEDLEWFLKEIDPENIKEKLMDDPVFYIDFNAVSHGNSVPYQIKIVLDPMYSYGNKILIGGHRIYK